MPSFGRPVIAGSGTRFTARRDRYFSAWRTSSKLPVARPSTTSPTGCDTWLSRSASRSTGRPGIGTMPVATSKSVRPAITAWIRAFGTIVRPVSCFHVKRSGGR
ncbi:MAG: hypothetical protein HMLKMBBP_03437 [Planctomycetes bacterium]|nr:hypothetical protein [Planctomycetota bacterium]